MHQDGETRSGHAEELARPGARVAQGEGARETAQATARQSEERFRKVFEHSNDAIFVVDPEADRILDVNSKACTLLGYSREELLATPVSAIHPGEMARFQAFARSVFENESGWTNELTCLNRSGQVLSAEISASVIDIGERRGMIALVRDITDRKRTEAALKRYSEELESLVEERTASLRRSEERHRALLEISNAIVANLDRPALFEAIAAALGPFLPFERASITLYDPARDVLTVYALAGPSPTQAFPVGAEFPRWGSHLEGVVGERRTLLRRDLETEPHGPLEDFLLRGGIRSYVAAPLVTKGKVLGTLNVGSGTPRRYGEEDARVVEEIATQVAPAVDNMLAYQEIAELKARLEQESVYLQDEIKTEHDFEEIIGASRAMQKVFKAVESVAATDSTVLLLGETGTGKELVARALHNLSGRREKALVKVNCAALPTGLVESELFGHEKGAFTGALARRIGRFELAHRGTIFLDEIGDLPLELQAKLLRVLQEGEFERVGGSPTMKVDVRVIAATNRDLERAVDEGRFRSDLYYRLNVFPIRIPPLRERPEDIPLLVKHSVTRYGRKLGKQIDTIPQRTMEALQAYPWPGNVRELENVIERSVILSSGRQLDLGGWVPSSVPSPQAKPIVTLQELERQHIVAALELTGGRVSGEQGAAELLGLKPTTLEARMKKLGITREGVVRPKIS
jgi:formate hydrogenlyase transcriptional activator